MSINDSSKFIAYGNLSFDTLPEFSEFDSDSVVEDYHRESSVRPSEEKMAPTTTIETITVTRPLKVIAFVCGLIVIALLIMALSSTDWLMAAGYRQGLFNHCIGENSPTPLPFHIQDKPGQCHKGRDVAYIKVAAALCVVALITDTVATLLTGLGLRNKDYRTKYKYYRVAVYVMIASLVATLLALVVYPVCFAAELTEDKENYGVSHYSNRQVWEFGWAYGVGWGAAIFLFGAVVLLLCDKESEEIYYKERKVTA